MNTELKCNCQYCNGHIAFPAEMVGQSINCPHCKLETLLFIPPAAVPHKLPEITTSKTRRPGLWLAAIAFGIVILVAALVAGNSQKQRQTNPTNLKPVVGAFGWTLGGKLPEQLKSSVRDGTYSFRPEQEMPPFDQCEIDMTDDGRIYRIQATGYPPDYGLDCDNSKSALISLLNEKYGQRQLSQRELMSMLNEPGENYYFGTVDRTAHLNIFNHSLLTLEYYDKSLRSVYYAEQEAKRQKDEAAQKAALSKGLQPQ